jgi:hypothetical protein
MRHARILAVHCGASHVAYGLFSCVTDRLVLERFGTKAVDAGDGTEEHWLAAAGAGLRDLIRGEGLRGGCVVGLPGHLTFNRSFRVPPVSARQRRKIIAFEQRQGLAAEGQEMVWSHTVVAEDGRGREMMLAVAKRRLVEELGARIREAGVHPDAALPAWLVLRNATGYLPAQAAGALVLSVGALSSQLVFAGAGVFSARTLAVGGDTVTRKVAEELQMDHAAAEALKLRGFEGAGDGPTGERERAAGRMAFDQFVRRLSAEILRSPPFAPSDGGAARPTVLWLTGGGARACELPAALAERLQLQVERWELRSHPGLGRVAADPGRGADDAALIDLVGLASWAAKGARREGNLLPRAFRREMFVRRRWPWLAAAALIVVAACLLPAWRLRAGAREARRQTAEADAAISVLRRVDALNRSNLARLAETRRRIAGLQKLARARSGWPALFGDLQERFASVQDVWLDRLQILASDPGQPSNAPPATAAPSESGPRGGFAGRPEDAAGVRLLISGSMLDVDKLKAGAGDGSNPKAGLLLTALRVSPLVAAVEREQFAGSQPGLVCFEITLRLAPDALF